MPKRQASRSPKAKETRSPKKAKVDPIADAVSLLTKFFAGAEVPKSVKGVIETSLEPSLTPPDCERHPVMRIFATAIGEALAQAVAVVDNKAANAQNEAVHAEADEASAQQAAAAASAHLQQCVDATAQAQERQDAAEQHLEACETDLAASQKEESQLSKQKEKLDAAAEDLGTALGTAAVSEPPTKKEVTKLVSVLKGCEGCNSSLLQAAPNALGKTEGFEAMVVAEIAKVLATKQAESTQKLQQWDHHVAGLKAAGADKANALTAATDQLGARVHELETAEQATTQAQAAKKASDKARAGASKASATKVGAVNDLADEVQKCADARAAYQLLAHHSGPPAPEAAAAPEAEA